MLFIVLTIILGLLLIYLEFFFPGKLFAVIGTAVLLSTIAYLLFRGYSPFALLMTLVLMSCVIMLICKIGFSHHRRKCVIQEQKATSEEGDAPFALTDLKPDGFISLKGKKVSARAEKESILRGNDVQIVRREGEIYIVK
jgi:membrane-bound ClpP family serine protease